MKKAFLLSAGLLLTASLASAAEIHWAKSLPGAFAKARATHKVVMIDFYTDWCGWCKKLDSDTYPDPKVAAVSEQLISVRVNAEKEGVDAAKKYGVHGFPTIIFADADGNELHRIPGYMPPEAFAGQMRLGIAAGHLPELVGKAKSNPNDAESLSELVGIYGSRAKEAETLDYLARLRKADAANSSGHLAEALNATGDMFQNANKLDRAITYFQQAEKLTKDPSVKAYALMSQAECFSQTHDKAGEIAALKKVKTLGTAAKGFEAEADGMLKAAGG